MIDTRKNSGMSPDSPQTSDTGFSERVEALVRQIPVGRVMTYGQIAALCGNARAARIVGGVAHFGDPELPWQRVVNKTGGLAAGYPGGRAGHKAQLEHEGIAVNDDYQVDVTALLWSPVSDEPGIAPEPEQLGLTIIIEEGETDGR